MRTIETERLLIRGFLPEDADGLFRYLSDPEVVRFEPYSPFTEEQCRAEAARRASDECFVAVCLRSTGELIGNLYFRRGDWETWELGYVFNRDFQKKGFARESAAALLRYAFSSLGVRRVIAECNPMNEPSWRLMERLGFHREGHLRRNLYFETDTNGAPIWLDTYIYGLFPDELRG